MTRSVVGVAAMAMVAAMTVAPDVSQAQTSADRPRLEITRGDGRVTISARARDLTVTQTLRPVGFDLRIVLGRDLVRVNGDTAGRVRVERTGRSLALSMAGATVEQAAEVRSLLAGSTALAAFDALVASEWARTTREAVVFHSAHAIVALLRGDQRPLQAFVRRVKAGREVRLIAIGQMTAHECWRSYERDVLRYTYELEICLADASNSLNPLTSAWCAYEYNLKTTLAFIWLLDCSGY
jgi:hypothetical protein